MGKIVSRYYKEDKDVKEDVDFQAYLNELSLDGTGPNGGIGRVNMKHIKHTESILADVRKDVSSIYNHSNMFLYSLVERDNIIF